MGSNPKLQLALEMQAAHNWTICGLHLISILEDSVSVARDKSAEVSRDVTMATITVTGRHWGCYTETDALSHLNLLLTSLRWIFSIICIFYFSFFKGTVIDFRVRKCAPRTKQPRPTLIPSCQHSSPFRGSGCFFSLKCLHKTVTWAEVKLKHCLWFGNSL